MKNLTDLLKKSTVIKNESGYLAAINYLKSLITDNDLKDKDAVRCTKKIAPFYKQEKSTSIEEATSFFLETIQNRVANNEDKYELYFYLSEYYYDKKQYDLSFKMINGAISSTNRYDFPYLQNLRNCFNKTAQIVLVSMTNQTERSHEYLYRITASCLFEIASEISFSLMDELRFYFDYREDDFSENYYLNDDDSYFDNALKTLGLLENKKGIVNSIHRFATYDIPKSMGFSEKLLAGDKKASRKGNMNRFDDETLILTFSSKLFSTEALLNSNG